ncbi:protein kinase [Streptomyces sp. NPDC059788]|uniref:protein kinase domain-containing protein n=1 Tax=Streptomyces sp. NPDC059788 TaxID=3346948 RepID=UPI00365B40A9
MLWGLGMVGNASEVGPGRLAAGRYRLLELIGRGGMGRVWRARDEILDRCVAVKEIRIDEHAGEESVVQRERSLREARATARIDHPNVVRVHDVAEEGDRLWIVMQLVLSRSLEQILAQDGPLAPAAAARVGAGLARALREVHAVGVLHRDIKPGNVLIDERGAVVLTDFGIAAMQDATALTMAGMLIGSPDYMAPERVAGQEQGPPSDLWSLGATLCAAVAGQSPFTRATTLATLHAVLHEEPTIPPAAGPLREVLVALLNKAPEARPTLDEVEARLEPLVRQAAAAAPTAPMSAAEAVDVRTPTVADPAPDRAEVVDVATFPTRLPPGEEREGGEREESGRKVPEWEEPEQKEPEREQEQKEPEREEPAKGAGVRAEPGTEAASPGAPAVEPVGTPPVEPVAGPPTGPLGTPAPSGRRPRRRRTTLLASAGALASAAAVVVVIVVTQGADPGGTAGSGSGGPATAGASTGTGSWSDGPAATAGPRRTENGFSWVPPAGWNRTEESTSDVTYSTKDGSTLVSARQDPSSGGDLLTVWRQYEAQQHDVPGYRRTRLERTTFQGHPAVVWEFAYTRDGKPAHGRQLGFRAGNRTYQLNLWYLDTAEAAALRAYDRVKESFRASP